MALPPKKGPKPPDPAIASNVEAWEKAIDSAIERTGPGEDVIVGRMRAFMHLEAWPILLKKYAEAGWGRRREGQNGVVSFYVMEDGTKDGLVLYHPGVECAHCDGIGSFDVERGGAEVPCGECGGTGRQLHKGES